MAGVREVTEEARRGIADFRAADGPAEGLITDMRMTLSHAREVTADLADNMEALKHNFLLRGYFTKRGYFDLDAISPVEYRNGVLENGKRKAMRIWLKDAVLFERRPRRDRGADPGRTRAHRFGHVDVLGASPRIRSSSRGTPLEGPQPTSFRCRVIARNGSANTCSSATG